MRVLHKDEVNDLLLNKPLLIFFNGQPFHISVLFIVSSLARSIDNFIVDFFELINSSDSFFKEGTSKVLLSDLKFSELTDPVSILWLNDDHVVL